MQTKDLLKAIKKEEQKLDEQQEETLFNKIVRGEDVTEQIKTSRGTFEIKYPRMADVERIGRLQAARRNEMAIGSFNFDAIDTINKIANLEVLTVRGPAWYENAKREKKNDFSVWQNIPLKSFIDEVYTKTLDFCEKVRNNLEQGGSCADRPVASDVDTKVDNSTASD